MKQHHGMHGCSFVGAVGKLPGHPLFRLFSPFSDVVVLKQNSPRAIFRRHGGTLELDFLEPRRRSLLMVMSPMYEKCSLITTSV